MKILQKLRIEVIRQFTPLIPTAKRHTKATPPMLQAAIAFSLASEETGGL